MQWCEAELAVTESRRRQPVFVERQPCGCDVRDRLVQARDKETTDTGIDHNAGITSDNVALNVTAAILVGGEARRLGGTVKPSLHIGDTRILDRQISALRSAGLDHIAIIGHWRDASVNGVHHVPDVLAGAGSLGGLYTALLVGTREIVLVLAGDMPFVTSAWLRRLASVAAADANVPRVGARWHPLCAAYRRRVAGTIKARIDQGRLRVTEMLNEIRVHELTAEDIAGFDPSDMLLMNVNTPDDYRAAERFARSRA